MSLKHGVEYYRARAMEMMEKAQGAPTKAIRLAYLNLARKWSEEADQLNSAAQTEPQSPPTTPEEPEGA